MPAGPAVVAGAEVLAGIGVDLHEVARTQRLLDRYDPDTLALVFTPAEQERARRSGRPAEHLTVCLAVKESVGKALDVGLATIAWTDVEAEVLDGTVRLGLHRAAAELAAVRGVRGWVGSWSAAAGRVLVWVLAVGEHPGHNAQSAEERC